MSGWAARTPRFTVAPKSVDRVIRYCAGSKVPTTRTESGSQRTTPFAAPAGHDRTASAGAHTKPESMHPCAAPVVRLERPLALGHGCLSLLRLATSLHPLTRVSTMAVGKLIRLASNRRGSHGPSFPRTEDQSGFAAVPPTFGRLFEGTDVFALGQTCAFAPGSVHRSPTKIPRQHRVTGPRYRPRPGPPRTHYFNVAERLALRDKTVSFCQCLFRPGRAEDNEARMPGRQPLRTPPHWSASERPSVNRTRIVSQLHCQARMTVLSTSVDNSVDRFVVAVLAVVRVPVRGISR
ncbi:hypothetical protein BH10ACT9_BH10ACT9_18970 [soil metagenome]